MFVQQPRGTEQETVPGRSGDPPTNRAVEALVRAAVRELTSSSFF